MGANSKIAWTDHTFNPWIGCTKVASGCSNCYAEADFDKRRHKAKWGPNGTRVRTSGAYWKQPLKWNREAATTGAHPRVFCASLCDVFEQWGGVIQGTSISTFNDVRRDLFTLIDDTPNLDWLLLTKRPENIRKMWPEAYGAGRYSPAYVSYGEICGPDYTPEYHRRNVWLGCSASTQQDLDAAIPHLLACRDLAPVLFLSLEPLVGPVDLGSKSTGGVGVLPVYRQAETVTYRSGLTGEILGVQTGQPPYARHSGRAAVDWVIVGGESGPNARPCDVAWIRDIVKQCKSADAPVFVKQLGTACRGDLEVELSETYAYRGRPAHPKGGDPIEWPKDLRVREFPR